MKGKGIKMREIVIAGAARTAIGNFGGALKGISVVELGRTAAVEAMNRAGVKPEQIDEVIFGCVLSAGLGQNPARQVSVKAGIPYHVPSMTINKVCGSGLKSVALAAQAIAAGDAEIILAGGMENMSNTAYVMDSARWGARMGETKLMDSMIQDGLTDIFNNYHMGITAENIAEEKGITKQMQDEFAVASQNKAEAAIKAGKFKEEIVPVVIPQRKGDPIVFDTDEFPRFGSTYDKLSGLKPAFKKDGTVTSGNASGINDGAAAIVVMSKEKADELGIKPLATIAAYASAGVKPETMGYGPIFATRAVLAKAGMQLSEIDLIEANEAFASQAISVSQELGFDAEKVNVNGGAIALGHPIGASGTRILVTLLYEMGKRDAKTGLATLCIGGGQGIAMIIKR